MGRGGFEPPTHGFSVCELNDIKIDDSKTYEKGVSESVQNSAISLSKTLEKYPDLKQILDVWPRLSTEEKRAILDIVRNK